MGSGFGFSKTKYWKILFASFSSLYHCVFCKCMALPSCFLGQRWPSGKTGPRCARQGCKSKIFSALRAPDTRENGWPSLALSTFVAEVFSQKFFAKHFLAPASRWKRGVAITFPGLSLSGLKPGLRLSASGLTFMIHYFGGKKKRRFGVNAGRYLCLNL